MITLYSKIKRMWMVVAIAAMATLGAAHLGFAKAPAETRLYLVSIGVGDVDLITLRAIDTIKKSHVIVCRKRTEDKFEKYLKDKEILDDSLSGWRTYKKDCADIKDKAGKEKCRKNIETRAKLIAQIRHALDAGKTVSILGSGDLLIYGGPYRWYLDEFKDFSPKIIPGVSCFNAANAALGKDIMLGKESHSAVLTTVREMKKFSEHHPTMVIFTMHTKFEDLVEKLKTQYPPKTPIAVVFHAGYKDKEQITRGRLDTILQKTQGRDFPFEHLVYVGDFMK
jgi:precorrin-4/cobalt-precorrin-4 C11-methyltransferase